MYNLLIGGAAGQGVDTTAAILERWLKQSGSGVFAMRDLMSRIRGGHNFSRIRFGAQAPQAHSERLDGMIALNEETVALHRDEVRPDGFILCDASVHTDDPRAIRLDMAAIAKELGNPRVAGSVAIGAAMKLFGIPMDETQARKVFEKAVKAPYVDINVKAAEAGYRAVPQKFEHVGGSHADTMILSGSRLGCSFIPPIPCRRLPPSWNFWHKSRRKRALSWSRRRTKSRPSTWPSGLRSRAPAP